MQQDFAEIIPKAGQPSNVRPVPHDVIEAYRGRVPDGLLEFWTEVGWCSFQDGYFWVSDPQAFDGLLRDVFQNDPEYAQADFVIFKYDAFGKLYGWRNDTKIITLDIAAYNPVFSSQQVEERPVTSERWTDDRYVANSISLAKEERTYFAEQDLNDFERALSALGPLKSGEIYGYSPAFALGGQGTPETLVKTPIIEHLLMLNQFVRIGVERYILDANDSNNPYRRLERVREIGSPR
ncbi:GAD-like domain-containing protein [Rhizobium sophoriradicis]|uniref:GAD-like domain-containing protein n=1 Tax=Rhizobium sophoriradicis TaxID=1535245 RepID=UPI00148272C2|nr:GAD-like domain-containing protein [Rhizobium sophoriradicis]